MLRIKKSEQCSDLGGWVGHRKMDVQIYKSVGSKNMFLSDDQQIFHCGCSDFWLGEWVTKNPHIVWIFKSIGINGHSLRKLEIHQFPRVHVSRSHLLP